MTKTKQPANSMKGEADVELDDGRTLRLCFNANTWFGLEELSGKDMPEIIELLQGGKASMRLQRQMMFCGLQKYQPEITIEEAGEVLFEAATAMAAALAGGLPQGAPDGARGDEADDDDQEAGTDATAGPPKTTAGVGTTN